MNREVSGKWMLLLKSHQHNGINWYEAFTYDTKEEAIKNGTQLASKHGDLFINEFMVFKVAKQHAFTTRKIKK